MTIHIQKYRLRVAPQLYGFIENEVLPGTRVYSDDFWRGFDAIVHDLTPKNHALLQERARLQKELDAWHDKHSGPIADMPAYKDFLRKIGYLTPVPEKVTVRTENVAPEVSQQGGPQLVVPLSNARYVLNAVNSRWLSLYDALYGTDAIDEDGGAERTASYNPVRGEKVIAYGRDFMDRTLPLQNGSHHDVVDYSMRNGKLTATMQDGRQTELKQPEVFAGFDGDRKLLFRHNELHIELVIDRNHPVGQQDKAGIRDIILESATTVIMDLEDAVAAVDEFDKVEAYRNWLGLMKGDLSTEVYKDGRVFTRSMDCDRHYTAVDGGELVLHGRSMMFVRNVGLLMTTPAVLDQDGNEIPEGILDAVVTILASMHDLDKRLNCQRGSIYIVKPKMHGPDEAAFTDELFTRVEEMLGLPHCTVKIGIMDEERRTSVNLKACIAATADRLAFINTGFLDRTGDEMFTAMHAGAMVRKGDMRKSSWIHAYEVNNVQVGLACGMRGRAQIGKGMWAVPDRMKDMLEQKQAHLEAGANTAWVPSPTAAVLHAIHYHQVDVRAVQQEMDNSSYEDVIDALLTIPVEADPSWTPEEIQQELDNNAQGILGYVVRWVEQGIGCSKVPDIHDIALMEDRATLRISSLHIANWMLHGIVTEEQVMATLQRMATVVDAQNGGDPAYISMARDFDNSTAFKAAYDLVFKGRFQPSGYTEPLLHAWRQEVKAQVYEPELLRKAS